MGRTVGMKGKEVTGYPKGIFGDFLNTLATRGIINLAEIGVPKRGFFGLLGRGLRAGGRRKGNW